MKIDPRRDALVVVDLQNDFCPDGALAVRDGHAIVPVVNRYLDRFGQAGAPIFLTRDWHPLVTQHFQAYGGVWPPHCVQGTHGAAFHAGLAPPAGAVLPEEPNHLAAALTGTVRRRPVEADRPIDAFDADDRRIARRRFAPNTASAPQPKRCIGGLPTAFPSAKGDPPADEAAARFAVITTFATAYGPGLDIDGRAAFIEDGASLRKVMQIAADKNPQYRDQITAPVEEVRFIDATHPTSIEAHAMPYGMPASTCPAAIVAAIAATTATCARTVRDRKKTVAPHAATTPCQQSSTGPSRTRIGTASRASGTSRGSRV